MNAKELILERFDTLSRTLQAAARFVVDHPNEVVITSMRTLAERALVQPATLVRLAQRLGYAGWPELKDAFAADLGLHARGYGQRAKTLVGRAQDTALIGEMFDALRRNLDVTEAESATTLRGAARLLRRARTVYVAGFRASLPVAYSLVYGYRLFRNEVRLIDSQCGGLEMQLRAIGSQDAVVVISFAPYSQESLVVINAAKAAGARIVALTDSSASPLALATDNPVLFAVDSPSFFPSVAAAVAATEALLELLVADAGEEAVRRIDDAEKYLFDSGAYLLPPRKRRTI
ncbi:MAG: MurR/RpiR family transcriptional regulator [Betaproteobacteria bacterium]|nr:MurR/RpiR family transcriptional regulator [Betaproteobacteria bacterium]